MFRFSNTYAEQLSDLAVSWSPANVREPKLIQLNEDLARELQLDPAKLRTDEGLSILSGNQVPDGATPIAQAYAGHQFGGFSPQLGDGRALLLGEVLDVHGKRRDIAFKGSGRTPFSRGGDGKATLGPMLREHLIGEAMHALGIPTTRVLAVVTTGERVERTEWLPGALITRVASSHIRVGTFQYVAAQGDLEKLRRLTSFVIERHYPDLPTEPNRYLNLLRAVIDRQAALIARWMNVGFIHGVMNTDNMTLSGETIDYGPCAFVESYSPRAVFSSIDRNGRYAFGNQPTIAKWNLARFAETLLPLIDENESESIAKATAALSDFDALYQGHWLAGVRAKFGITEKASSDLTLAKDWFALLESQSVDFTCAHRWLADAAAGEEGALRKALGDAPEASAWLGEWRARLNQDTVTRAARSQSMRAVSPVYIPRNHKVEEALKAAVYEGDLKPYEHLLLVVTAPFADNDAWAEYSTPAEAAVTARYQTFCGT
jgi:uncharacterized protein YdiU (UPF0061 family)